MRLVHYTVSQIRVAATCPRLHWFDARESAARGEPVVSRIWRKSEVLPGGGALFHRGIERFNAMAATAPEVLEALSSADDPEQLRQVFLRYFNGNCIKLEALAERDVPLRRAFIAAVHAYMDELSNVAAHARRGSVSARDVQVQLFGDNRKRVDVTFHVAGDVQVHVTGAIDYVFFDTRLGRHRIIDYKLTPARSPNNDLFQVYTYALMHHHQHGTNPDVAVFYLHPERQMFEAPWERVLEHRARVYDLIASMVAWSDSARGEGAVSPPGDTSYCSQCKHERSGECASTLGPKERGDWDRRWRELASSQPGAPSVDVREPESSDDPEEEEDSELASADQVIVAAPAKPVRSARKSAPRRAPKPPPAPETDTDDPEARPSISPPTSEVSDGLFVGESPRGPVTIDPCILRTHVAVVGAAGSGKTWMAKVITEEALRSGVPVLAIDPQGDLVQMLSGRDVDEVAPHLRPAFRDFHSKVEVRIFTPGTSHGIRLSLDPVRLPSAEDLQRISNPDRRAEEETQLVEAVAANLVGLCRSGGEEKAQRAFLYRVLASMPKTGAIRIRDIVAAVSNPDSLGLEEDELNLLIRKPDREKLARTLNTFTQGASARLFEGGTRLDLSDFVRPSEPGRVPLNVVYLNALTDDDQKHFFLSSLATEVYRWMITRLDATKPGVNLLFYIDEARDWIPAGSRKPAAKDPLIRLFTQGRKYGVGCLFCTQSPRSVDYNVFGNASTKFIGRLEAAQDVDRVTDWFSNDGGTPPWIAARKGAAKGSFVARWPDMPEHFSGLEFKGRQLFTRHEGAWSPDRVEREVERVRGSGTEIATR